MPELDLDWLSESLLYTCLVEHVQLNEGGFVYVKLLQLQFLQQDVERAQGLSVVPTDKLGLVILVEKTVLQEETLGLPLSVGD